jgi:stage V sporulation protein R
MAVVHKFRELGERLTEIQSDMERYASQYGLDFFPTIFELVDHDQLSEIAAYGGFPTRYPHWRFGMEYERLSKGYSYGLQKIYELVINNDPCYAYLLASNEITDHKLVMAHVYGHCDFFKNNAYFAHTNRKMIDEMANHGNRIRRYMDRFGVDKVETFIDACLSLEGLIDIHSTFIQRSDRERSRFEFPSAVETEDEPPKSARFNAKNYMNSFVNPKDRNEQTGEADEQSDADQPLSQEPNQDVLLFLLRHAPLKPWQADILAIVRDESYYFAPQGQTKIMNEGWATFWHSTIMTRHGIEPADLVCYADHCAGTLASSPTRLNPYKLGVELFRDIEDRWNQGRFGPEWDSCDDLDERRQWNTHAGLGREKIFEVRKIHNDVTFIDEFLTLEFCRRHKMFSFGYNENHDQYEIESRQFDDVKQQLLFNLTNAGRPRIYVNDGNHKNRGELLMKHDYAGVELKTSYATGTLANLYSLWRRPVHLDTVLEEQPIRLSFDGKNHSEEQLGEAQSTDNATIVITN